MMDVYDEIEPWMVGHKMEIGAYSRAEDARDEKLVARLVGRFYQYQQVGNTVGIYLTQASDQADLTIKLDEVHLLITIDTEDRS